MISYRVELNGSARQQVLLLGEQAAAQDEHPSDRLAGSHLTLDHDAYVPGLSVPDVKGLEEPFVVPLVGDDHSLRASIEYPWNLGDDFRKKASLVGMLATEQVRFESSNTDDELDPNTSLNEAFQNMTGNWGGVLSTIVEVLPARKVYRTKHKSELLIFDSKEEREDVEKILRFTNASTAQLTWLNGRLISSYLTTLQTD